MRRLSTISQTDKLFIRRNLNRLSSRIMLHVVDIEIGGLSPRSLLTLAFCSMRSPDREEIRQQHEDDPLRLPYFRFKSTKKDQIEE